MTIPLSLHEALHEAKVDLAAALRAAATLGLHEGVCNHFSLALPADSGEATFLINPQGVHWSDIVPSDLVTVDMNGIRLEGKHPVEPTAFFIHGRIHKAKKNAVCVMHTHMPYATALTLLEEGKLEPASQNALRFYRRTGYYSEYRGLALDNEEGDRICAALADAEVLFMANHGVIVCGDSVANTFDDLYYLERACTVQLLAQSTGKPLRKVPESIAAHTAMQFTQERQQSALHFAALKAGLERRHPGWSGL
jgi:ribulose-5-phosphate 4-epimerase/fuculose-1-phosphate aldolase